MAKRKKKTKGFGKLLIVGVLLISAVAAGAYYYIGKSPLSVKPPAQKPIVTIKPGPALAQERSVCIYLPKDSKNGFYLAKVATTTHEQGDILSVALMTLLATNKQGGVAAQLIPEGTKLLSPVQVKGGVATVNLSKEFTDNFSGGSDQEALTVNAVAHTLVSNSGGRVDSVRILVGGEAVETLGGHLELTDPVKADSTLLRPGGVK